MLQQLSFREVEGGAISLIKQSPASLEVTGGG